MQTMPPVGLALIFAAGLTGLTLGGDWLCRGATGLSVRMNIRPVVVGLTVVSVATSMPELFTSLAGSLSGADGLAIGNIVGSNIGNIGLILGIAAIVSPLVVRARLIRADVPILIAVSLIFTFLCATSLSRWDGVWLLLLCAGYFVFLLRRTGQGEESDIDVGEVEEAARHSPGRIAVLISAGAVALALGAELLVRSSVETASRLGVGDALIGLTVVAVGTSLPELATSITAALKRQADLCAGNIVGSNLFNLILISGVVALAAPIQVERELFALEFPVMLFFTFLLWPVFFTGRMVSRGEGVVLLGLYALFILATIHARAGLW